MVDFRGIVAITCVIHCLVTAGQGVFREDYPTGNYSDYLHNNTPGMVFRGNPVISRNGYLPTSAFLRTYIDANAQLFPGLLKEIMFYTHGIDTAPTPGMNRLRVQIWKPVGNAGDNEYELVWEYHEQELEIGPIGVLWKLIIDEENSITLTGSEFLGVTYESGVGLLSLEFTDSGVTYFRNIPNPSFDSSEPMFPLVGNTYTFADVHIPSILSIGAVIEEGSIELTEGPVEERGTETTPVLPSDIMEVPPSDVMGVLNNLPDQEEFHGNEIALRSAYLPSGARKSWIDADLVLPSGWLREFWFYTHNIPESLLEPDVSDIRLQIWGQEGNSDSYMYKLRWEYSVTNLDLGSNNGKAWRFQVPESETIWLETSDRMGFTLESHVGIISFKYVNERNMIFRDTISPETGEDDFPEVGHSYQFDSTSLPAVWSIGVVIKKGASRDEPRNDSEEIFVLQRIPGGNYLSVVETVPSTTVFGGNPVILREDYSPTGARKSFIDITQQLPAGLLREFLFYTHNFANDDMVPDRFEMRAQIWKQTEPSTEDDKYRYTLLWEHRVTGTVGSESGILWRLIVPESRTILLDGSEFLGFTSESNVGVISLKYTLPAATRFRNVPVLSTSTLQFPEIGFTYTFGTLPLPAIFSIGAIIDTGTTERTT